jgi:hypothetical protein
MKPLLENITGERIKALNCYTNFKETSKTVQKYPLLGHGSGFESSRKKFNFIG